MCIIAIVAVAMIGVVVPSVFAETSAQEKYDPFSREQCHNETHVIPDKYVYESGETVTFTVEIFDPCYPARGNGYYDLELWVGHVSNELESDGEVGKVGVSIETILIKTGQQKTFQFTPEILTFTQEYLVLEKIGNGMNELIQYDQENNRMFDENGDGMYLSFVVLPPQNTQESTTSEGGCLIATATYGSEMATEVQQLRELRDNQLLQTESGTAFMKTFNDVYYSFSPTIADMERESPIFKEIVKVGLTPMISSLSLMESANSESEVLSIGISVIMLNIGMYLGVPAVVIIGIRKRI
ncbi:hypothetical protein N8459_01950 [Nitrosopumilus sp.]|nr:hypothetical protein [Nitrosopumilus sp.]